MIEAKDVDIATRFPLICKGYINRRISPLWYCDHDYKYKNPVGCTQKKNTPRIEGAFTSNL